METEAPDMHSKTRSFSSRKDLLEKLGEKSAMWHRVALESQERSEEFERAARQLLAGASSVTVGRTTYTVDGSSDEGDTQR